MDAPAGSDQLRPEQLLPESAPDGVVDPTVPTSVAEPVAEPMAEPVTEPMAEPVAEPAAEDHPVQQLIFMDLKFILEALLFTSQKPLSVAELRDFLTQASNEEGAAEATRALRKLPSGRIEEALAELSRDHEIAGRSYRLVCVAGAWQFVTEPDYAPWLRAMLGVKNRPSRLSQAALETLAIIAYRQPITRAEMEQIRGVAVDGTIATLLERHLIQQAGRAEVIGRPMQYATTSDFLTYFGLASLSDLPSADELRRIPVQRPENLQTVDPGLATVPPDTLPQMSLDQAESAAAATGAPEATEPLASETEARPTPAAEAGPLPETESP